MIFRLSPAQRMLPAATTNRHQARLAVMRSVQHALAEATDVQQVFRALHRELGRVMDTTGFILGLHDDGSQMVEIVGQIEAGAELPGGSFPLGEGFLSQVIRTGHPRHIRHWSVEGPRVQVQYATGTPGLPEATVTVPLLVGKRTIGVLSAQSYIPDAYDDDDLFLMQAMAAQVGPTIDSLQQQHASHAVRRVTKLEAVLSSMNEGLLILDRDGRIISLNPPARAMFGPMDGGIILGLPLDREQWGKWPPGARAVAEALAPVLDALHRGDATRDLEVELNTPGRRVLSFSSAPLSEATGERAGGVVVFRDITTQRDVGRLKDDLLSIASHDLRTPATVIKIQAQMLKRQLEREPLANAGKFAERVEMIEAETDRLGGMLNLLLDVSRVEAGRLDLGREPFDLVKLIRRVVAAVQELSSSHQLVVVAEGPVVGTWDAARLEQVLQNLLTNGIKYAPDGGIVTVQVNADPRDATVSVSDQGLGIAPEELPHLFDRFYRIARTRGLEGSGLGLYICQGIIAAHGGSIWADSAGLGRGSTFAFRIPFDSDQKGT
jgi:signal transduction histidine kinase